MQPLIIVGFVALFIVIGVLGYISSMKRRQAMMALAAKLGLNFYYQKDRDMARRYCFLDKLRHGRDRYAFNVLSGNFQGNEVGFYDLTIEARVNVIVYTGTEWTEDSFVKRMELHIGRGTLELDKGTNLSQRKFYEGLRYEQRANFDYIIELEENSLYENDVKTISPEPYEPLWTVRRPPCEV